MSTKHPLQSPKPSLLLPPGPAVRSIHILPSCFATDPAEHRPIPQLFYDALTVRRAVFGIEQNCSADGEIDGDDGSSWHWVIHAPLILGGEVLPAATIRLIPAPAQSDPDDVNAIEGPNHAGSTMWDHKEPYVMIGRLATIKEFRGRGYGRVLVEAALEYAGENAGSMVNGEGLGEWKGLVFAHAQKEVERWYHGLRFVSDEGMGRWCEEGIEHVGIWKRVNMKE